MNKDEQKELILKVKAFIKTLGNYTDEGLVHFYKSALSKKDKHEKEIFAPLLKEIEKLRDKNGWSRDVSSRGQSLEKTIEESKQPSKPKSKKGKK